MWAETEGRLTGGWGGFRFGSTHDCNGHYSQTLNEASENMREANLFVFNSPELSFQFLALCWCFGNVSVGVCAHRGWECVWALQRYEHDMVTTFGGKIVYFSVSHTPPPHYQPPPSICRACGDFSPSISPHHEISIPWNTIYYFYVLYVYLYFILKKK